MWTSSMLLGGAGAYLTASADFDGTNDYTKRGAGLTGAVDGKTGILSFWFRLDGGDAAVMAFLAGVTTLGGSTHRSIFYRDSTGKIILVLLSAAGVSVLSFASNATYTSGATWHHLLTSWDLAAGRFQFYMDDVADTATPTTMTNTDIDYTVADWSVGARTSGDLKFNGCLAELYFNIATSLDLSVASNRRKFISTSGKPVILGADGSRPTGSQPIIYQKIATNGVASDFATNLGSGGNFTVTGALTLGSDSPSD